MLDVATLNVKQQLTRIIASCAFNKFNSNPCSIQLRNSSDHVVLVRNGSVCLSELAKIAK